MCVDDRCEEKRQESAGRESAEAEFLEREAALRERNKELNCLISFAELAERHHGSLPDLLRAAVETLPPAWQFPSIASARIVLNGEEFHSLNFTESRWKQTSDIFVKRERAGAVEVYYARESVPCAEGPFLKEERILIDALARRLGASIERDQALAALRQSEAKYRTLIENLPQNIFLKDRESVYVSCNGSYAREMGLRPDELAGKTDFDLYPKELAEKYRSDDRRTMVAGATEEIEETYLRQGEERWVRTVKTPVRDEAGAVSGVLGIFWDITDQKRIEEERKTMEAQLRQAQKLESIGTLASGVAHEINNPINGIMGYAQLMLDRPEDQDRVTRYAGEVIRESERIAGIVRHLLTFARDDRETPVETDLAEVVEGTLSLVQTILRHDHVQLEVGVPEDLPPVQCRPQQVQQVLMNLITNARDALNEKFPDHDPEKRLSIRASACEREGKMWVRLSVEDRGTGISEEVRERMFDPFYTTKGRRHGTGLGLSMSHGIVREHQGELTVETEPGQFTRFHLDLPVQKPTFGNV